MRRSKTSDAEYRAWTNILLLAGEHDPAGALPSMKAIANWLKFSEKKAENLIRSLIKKRFVDVDENGVLFPHDWDKFQFQSDGVSKRTRGWRQRRKEKQEATLTAESRTLGEADVNVPVNSPPLSPYMVLSLPIKIPKPVWMESLSM